MPKSEVFEAPSVHTKKTQPPKERYYFENRKCPGQSISCVMGRSPIKGKEQMHETMDKFTINDGDTVELTDEQYNNLRTRGINKPVLEVGAGGEKRFTGEYRLDKRFTLEKI